MAFLPLGPLEALRIEARFGAGSHNSRTEKWCDQLTPMILEAAAPGWAIAFSFYFDTFIQGPGSGLQAA
jgi:hypothetical protein